MTDDISIDVPIAADWDDFFEVVMTAFHEEPTEAVRDAEELFVEIDRCLVARRDGEMVGTAGILTRDLAVPGATVPAAHITLISVAATARRQGVLTRFMGRQFADARAAGESIAVLWASEGRIYQRFGYGLAATRLALTAESRELELLLPESKSGRLRPAEPTVVRAALTAVYERVYADRPGWSQRTSRHWDYRLADVEAWRRGATPLRAVTHEGDDGIDGYALWRAARAWSDTGPAGEVRLFELVAATPTAYTALWRFLLRMDLTRTVSAWACAPDEPIMYAVNEPRRLDGRLSDALWVRILDVPTALAARRYLAPIDVVVEVTDAMVPENSGRWRLTGSPTAATCTSTVDEPDLRCDIRALGAAYLGGTPLVALAATGQVTEQRPGALVQASAAFGWHRAPSSMEVF